MAHVKLFSRMKSVFDNLKRKRRSVLGFHSNALNNTTTLGTSVLPPINSAKIPSTEESVHQKQIKAIRNPLPFNQFYEDTGVCLGAGSYGSVKRYKHRETGREYAVKSVQECTEVFYLMQHRTSSHVLTVHEFFDEHNVVHLVMDEVKSDLWSRIRNSEKGRLDEYVTSVTAENPEETYETLHSTV